MKNGVSALAAAKMRKALAAWRQWHQYNGGSIVWPGINE
jgi:hypothetical protein